MNLLMNEKDVDVNAINTLPENAMHSHAHKFYHQLVLNIKTSNLEKVRILRLQIMFW